MRRVSRQLLSQGIYNNIGFSFCLSLSCDVAADCDDDVPFFLVECH